MALALASAVGAPECFAMARAVGTYEGLASRRWQSGEVDCSGRISRRGDAMLRRLLDERASCLPARVRRAHSSLHHPHLQHPQRVVALGVQDRVALLLARRTEDEVGRLVAMIAVVQVGDSEAEAGVLDERTDAGMSVQAAIAPGVTPIRASAGRACRECRRRGG